MTGSSIATIRPARSDPGLSVVLPARNEAGNLDAQLDEIEAVFAPACSRLEIVVVDDGSRDATPAVLAAARRRIPALRVVTHRAPLGYGGAARSGLVAAREDLVLFTDADRQFELTDALELLSAIADAELAIGYRFDRHDTRWRRALGRAWSTLVNLLFGYTARDVDCALKLTRRSALAAVLPQLRSQGAAFSAEWLILARRAGQRIVERPVRHRARVAGQQSGARLTVALGGLLELARLRLTRLPRPAALPPTGDER